jgi:hypothetical protein
VLRQVSKGCSGKFVGGGVNERWRKASSTPEHHGYIANPRRIRPRIFALTKICAADPHMYTRRRKKKLAVIFHLLFPSYLLDIRPCKEDASLQLVNLLAIF